MPYVTSWERMGMKRGQRMELMEAILVGLEANYAAEGSKLLSQAQAIQDVEVLRSLLHKIIKGAKLAALRRWLSSQIK